MKNTPQDYLFWMFSMIAIERRYKDIEPCLDLFKAICDDYEVFLSDEQRKNNSLSLAEQSINYFETLID
jgi:hypothetical protein